MYVEDKCARALQFENRPCGYILIRSFNPLAEKPSYWGEIEIRNGNYSVTFCYTMENFDVDNKKYHIAIFSDRYFRYRELEAYISFIDQNSRLISVDTIFIRNSTNSIPDEFFNFLHIAFHYRFSYCIPKLFKSKSKNKLPELMKAGYVFGLDYDEVEDFCDETFFPIKKLISTLNLIMG